MSSISKRFTDLRQSYRNKPYERHKDSLEVQLSSFLFSLVPSKKLSAATAEDIVKFLISKDSAGKRKLHFSSCSRKICNCPKRLAAGTVDSYIGKLRSIFNKLGRVGMSNPLSHPTIKEYLKFVREEQAQQPLRPRHAVPLFYEKSVLLITYLRGRIAEGSGFSPLNKYLLLRDITFSSLIFTLAIGTPIWDVCRLIKLSALRAEKIFF